MNGWEITIIIIWSLNLGVTAAKHGESMGIYNIYNSAIGYAILISLYIKAGLFN